MLTSPHVEFDLVMRLPESLLIPHAQVVIASLASSADAGLYMQLRLHRSMLTAASYCSLFRLPLAAMQPLFGATASEHARLLGHSRAALRAPNRVAGLMHSMPCSCMLETTSHRLLGEASYPLCYSDGPAEGGTAQSAQEGAGPASV